MLSAKDSISHWCETIPSLRHGLPDLHGDAPGRNLVDLEIARKLEGRQPLIGVQDERDRQEPLLKGKVGVMEDRADSDAERSPAVIAMPPALFLFAGDLDQPAVDTAGGVFPLCLFEMGDAGLLGGKRLENLYNVYNDLYFVRVIVQLSLSNTHLLGQVVRSLI